MIKVLRSTPIPVRPHIVFSLRTSYNLQTSSFLSDKSTKGKSYLAINLLCEAIVSLLTPSITVLFLLNSSALSLNASASLEQPGVLSLG